MVIYEVNLTIEKDIYPQYKLWLKEHVKEMLKIPGFISASILKPEEDQVNAQEKLTVQYRLTDRESLDVYFAQFAAKMRADGINRFKDKFSAERKIYAMQEDILNGE